MYQPTIESLNITHRILIRITLKGFDRINTQQLFDILKIVHLKQLYKYFSVIQLHSDIFSQGNKYLSITSKGRREDCLKVPRLNTTAYKNYYKYKVLLIKNKN